MSTPAPIDTAALPDARELRLPTIKALWPQPAQADREGWPAARLLTALTEHEIADRARRRFQRRLGEARLPSGKTLDSFDFSVVPTLSKAVMALCAGDRWLDEGSNLLLIGARNRKTHLSAAIGLALIEHGYRVPAPPISHNGRPRAASWSLKPPSGSAGSMISPTSPRIRPRPAAN